MLRHKNCMQTWTAFVKTNGAAAHDEFAKMQTNTFYHKIVQEMEKYEEIRT